MTTADKKELLAAIEKWCEADLASKRAEEAHARAYEVLRDADIVCEAADEELKEAKNKVRILATKVKCDVVTVNGTVMRLLPHMEIVGKPQSL